MKHLTVAAQQMRPLRPANEEIADGQVHKELEYAIYGKVLDFSPLERAEKKIIQRQSGFVLPHGIIRVRKSIDEGVVSYVETMKLFLAGGGRDELPTACSQKQHEFFMKATGESTDKTRHIFDAGNGLKWEVDIFTDLDGNFKPYCKIDLEVPSALAELPPFPLKLDDVIIVDPTKGRPDPATQARLDELNKRMFVNKVF